MPSPPRCGSPRSSTPTRSASSRRPRCARRANRDDVADEITRACGVPVEVLSEQEEGRLAFIGATRTLGHVVEGEVAVVDVGGGSTEIVLGTLERGRAQRLLVQDRVGLADGRLPLGRSARPPPRSARCASTSTAVFEGVEVERPQQAVAVGGSATSLRSLVGAVLEYETLERAIRVLTGDPIDDVAKRFELDPRRVRLLPAGRAAAREDLRAARLPAADRQGRAARRRDPGPAERRRSSRRSRPLSALP